MQLVKVEALYATWCSPGYFYRAIAVALCITGLQLLMIPILLIIIVVPLSSLFSL